MSKHIGGKLYYSVPEAAELVGVSRGTMFRWVTQGVPIEDGITTNGIPLKVLQDSHTKRYYLPEELVTKLAKRFPQRFHEQELQTKKK